MDEKDPQDIYEELFEEEETKPLFSYRMVGFFVPILGIIFYVVLKKEKRDIADAFLDGALVGLFTLVFVVLLLIGYFLWI